MPQFLFKFILFFVVFFPVLAQAQNMGPTAPVEWEVNIEGANDFRSRFDVIVTDLPSLNPVPGSQQKAFAPSVGLSYMRRITNLRGYYGLRLEGHFSEWEIPMGIVPTETGDTYTASALLAYKAFLFDMEGDCDCPRWDKTNFFKKAFFVEFGGGYGRQSFGREDIDERLDRAGVAYMARVGLAIRMKKQWDIYLAGGAHGLFAKELAIGKHSVAVRPALGMTWRPFYKR